MIPALSWWPWTTSQDFLKSDFFAGLFGAGAGAVSAYLFASWSERRKDRLKEIAASNAAIALCHSVINTAVTMKKQHIQKIVEEYRSVRKFAAEAAARRQQVQINMDMMTLTVPYMAGEEVQTTVIEGVLRSPRAHLMAIQVRQSVESFLTILKGRNELCAEIKAAPQPGRLILFLGLAGPEGGDLRYCAHMDALESYVDDCIYFPMLLQDILTTHINRIRRKLFWRAPQALTFDYTIATPYLPDRKKFADFEINFRKKEDWKSKLRRFPGRWWRGD